MFFDKKCTIWKIEIENNNHKESKKQTILYENIACDFYVSKKAETLSTSRTIREDEEGSKTVVLQGKYSEVRQGMLIELYDMGSRGKYIIEELSAYRLPSGKINNITLQVKLQDV